MDIKSQVLEFLENHRGESFSGQKLADELHVSRAAVWKAIDTIRKEGIEIEGATKRGYTLDENSNTLSAAGINSLMKNKNFYHIEVCRLIDSTNIQLKKLAQNGAEHACVLIAAEQSAGKGRLGKSFYSPKGTGIYVSVIIRKNIPPENALFITTAAGVAVCRAIEQVSGGKAEPKIKWVNDVYCGDKKVCGILTEASISCESNTLEYAVLGIGINLLAPDAGFPQDIENIAGSVFNSNEGNLRNRMSACLLDNLVPILNDPVAAGKEYMQEYKERSMLIGKTGYIISDSENIPCKFIDIDDNAKLKVLLEDGTTRLLSSGEVSAKLTDN